MKLTDELLLKYVEEELEPEQAARVERFVKQYDFAAERLRYIKLSGKALERERENQDSAQGGPQDSQGTSSSDLLAQSILAGDLDPPASLDVEKKSTLDPSQQNIVRPKGRWQGLQIAASIAMLAIGLGAGYMLGGVNELRPQQIGTAQPEWLVRVVDYHTLYDRRTVAPAHADEKTVKDLKHRFSKVLGQKVVIPVLDGQQLEFRRGQYLKFESSPIIQLAYLPTKTGRPVALCLKASNKKDSTPEFQRLNGLGVVQWHQRGVAYVLVGDLSETRLRAAAQNAQEQIGAKHNI